MAVFKAHKIIATSWMAGLALLTVTEAFMGQMIISLVVALIGATPPTVAIILMARKQSEERRAAQAVLMEAQNKMAIDLDGKLDRLSRAETGQAKAEGIIEGADKEQARVAVVAATPPPEVIQKMEIMNTEDNAVPTIPGKKKPADN